MTESVNTPPDPTPDIDPAMFKGFSAKITSPPKSTRITDVFAEAKRRQQDILRHTQLDEAANPTSPQTPTPPIHRKEKKPRERRKNPHRQADRTPDREDQAKKIARRQNDVEARQAARVARRSEKIKAKIAAIVLVAPDFICPECNTHKPLPTDWTIVGPKRDVTCCSVCYRVKYGRLSVRAHRGDLTQNPKRALPPPGSLETELRIFGDGTWSKMVQKWPINTENFKRVRILTTRSKSELGFLAGWTRSYINNMERGYIQVSTATAKEVLLAFYAAGIVTGDQQVNDLKMDLASEFARRHPTTH